jgi:hypothetical protein
VGHVARRGFFRKVASRVESIREDFHHAVAVLLENKSTLRPETVWMPTLKDLVKAHWLWMWGKGS